MLRRALAAAALLVAAGCATLAPAPPLPTLSAVPASFEMEGRLAVRQGDRSDIAKLTWTRTRSHDVWVISSPLGNELATIESAPDGAVLRRAGDGTEQARDFQSLTRRLLGVALDPRWLAEGLHGQVPQGLPEGWRFDIDEKQAAGAVQLAKRITVTNGDTVVRLVVDRYQPLGD